MDFKLNIDFSEKALDTISKANQKVVLVKHTAGDTDSQVSWVSFKPWKNNTVEWSEEFAIYASNSQVQNGATIRKLSDKQAATGVIYPFKSGYFNSPYKGANLPSNSYIIQNKDEELDGITVGLAQSVVINGEAYEHNPINAVFLPRGQYASMSPLERIDVYLRNDIEDSTVISHITSNPLTVLFADGETTHTIHHNSATGDFYLSK